MGFVDPRLALALLFFTLAVLFLRSHIFEYGSTRITTKQRYLSRIGKELMLNGEKVFLSGMNQAWVHYAEDFGNGKYESSRAALYKTLNIIRKSGGNSIRIWLHVGGQNTPTFDRHGYVTGPGKSLISDLRDFLLEAQRCDVLVNICLWNAAVMPTKVLHGLILDDTKLTTYIERALVPIVKALRDLRALASWEIINEPEGSVKVGRYKSEPCFDTSHELRWLFADWTGAALPLERMLRFIARQSDAIHRADPKSLVTVGIWTYKSIATSLYQPNYFSDVCLKLAGGVTKAGLDYYQLHTYDLEIVHIYLRHSPFKTNAAFYNVTKPVLIGEFSAKRGAGMTSPEQFLWAYTHGYSGAWSWSAIGGDGAADTVAVQEKGMATLRGRHNQTLGGRVNINLNNRHTIYFLWIVKRSKIF